MVRVQLGRVGAHGASLRVGVQSVSGSDGLSSLCRIGWVSLGWALGQAAVGPDCTTVLAVQLNEHGTERAFCLVER